MFRLLLSECFSFTTEIEQVNQERADCYREELPMKVDAQLKEVVQRRKQVPYACARHIATQCKHQQSYLVRKHHFTKRKVLNFF